MAVTPIYISAEMTTGEVYDSVRVLAADKIGTEKTCKVQGWDYSDGPRAHTLMAYYALQRTTGGRWSGYEQFCGALADYSITTDPGAAQEDPTQAGNAYSPSWPSEPVSQQANG